MGDAGQDLHKLGKLGVAELVKYNGMGEAKAITIVAALELGRRRRSTDAQERPSITTSASAHELIRSKLAELPNEVFWVILLDRGNRLLELRKVSEGGLHGTVADPKVIFKMALDHLSLIHI